MSGNLDKFMDHLYDSFNQSYDEPSILYALYAVVSLALFAIAAALLSWIIIPPYWISLVTYKKIKQCLHRFARNS